MAQLQGSHSGYRYDAFWSVQQDTVFWGAVISQDGHVMGRPKGQLQREAIDGDEVEAIRHVVATAIDKNVGVDAEADADQVS
ncbi:MULTISPECIES: hypothetical protein [Oleiagrimonas]|uniref:Uncharacterized protein n=1 Tax=Oleiagrimonas citrea TaxID=1665687 RepID=A0A846ZRX4_9GAMM|nr:MULTISPECIES: hypothetical protein [Oleiagrimonas]NKZ40203.1 hypothetical protein [Oleiagrimonas citrea]